MILVSMLGDLDFVTADSFPETRGALIADAFFAYRLNPLNAAGRSVSIAKSANWVFHQTASTRGTPPFETMKSIHLLTHSSVWHKSRNSPDTTHQA